ncbi:MAG: PocR ligand-binding domain-containing protein [Dethiosulfatibacter sp.]|nr:PocR ligand-binding domain-containing protein [Dethiosulfatibacter sp.]
MKSKILDYVDFNRANALLEGFNKSTGFVTAILDLDGNILSQSGWRQICTDFHRNNPEAALNCFVSDTSLSNKMITGEKYHFYECMNGLIDVVLPIVIRGEHIANLFSGQFFFEEPDIVFFKKQAKLYGFEESAYLASLETVPVVSKEKVESAMDFLLAITQTIIEMTADKMEQIEINEAIRKSEVALRDSQVELEGNLKDLLESQRIAHVGTWRLNVATNQVVWSEELYKMYGFDSTAPVPPYPEHMKLFTPESWNRLSTSLERTKASGVPYELELETVTIDGSNGWMWVRGEAERDSEGNIISLWGAAQDITEHKKAEVELNRIMTQNQRILDNLQDSYFQTNLSGNFIVVNPQAVDMYGYSSASELIGQPVVMLYADPEDRVRVLDELKREGALADLITKGLRKDGTTFWVSMNAQFVKDEQDRILGTESLVRDISERVRLIDEIELQRDNLMASNAKLAHMLDQSVKSISKIGELRDAYTAGHQKRVQDLSCAIAQQLGLSDDAIKNLSHGALIHDIGKIYIPSEILNKPGKISNIEYQILQTHAEYGYNVVKEIDFPVVIPSMVYQHHERLDGSGYPQGLSGEQIIIESRILAVSDVVEAMTSHRPYRPALGIDAALEEISTYRGQKYDCEVVDACIQLFREKGFQFSK